MARWLPKVRMLLRWCSIKGLASRLYGDILVERKSAVGSKVKMSFLPSTNKHKQQTSLVRSCEMQDERSSANPRTPLSLSDPAFHNTLTQSQET